MPLLAIKTNIKGADSKMKLTKLLQTYAELYQKIGYYTESNDMDYSSKRIATLQKKADEIHAEILKLIYNGSEGLWKKIEVI